jgi:adenine-specific DNA-methyltransferase
VRDSITERPKPPETGSALAQEAGCRYRIERTELVWPGKYDECGAPVLPPRLDLALEVLETLQERGAQSRAPGHAWRNKLIWGENLCVLSALVGELAAQVDLIYIDPPFLAGRDFSHSVGGWRRKAYYDTWEGGRDSYLTMLWQRLLLARELLSERGSIYFHIGPGVDHYVRALLDEIFGTEAGTEIVWKRTAAHPDSKAYGTVHDKILFYTKTPGNIWNEQYVAHDRRYLQAKYTGIDPDGRRYMLDNMTSPHPRPNMTYVWKGHEPPAMGWRYSKQTMAQLDAQGRIWYPDSKRKRPRLKRYLDESPGLPLSSVWTDIQPINSQAEEDTAYDTQKPEALLERIIAASSEPDSIVLDFFCGAGTTLAVAERLGRRWIGCDVGRFALHTSRKRLLERGARPFQIMSPGRHERKYWAETRFGKAAGISGCTEWVLELYGAQALDGAYIHGSKGGALVHVGALDTAVTVAQIDAAVAETKLRGARELHVLAWEWELGVFAAPAFAAARGGSAEAPAGIALHLISIPREIMEGRAVAAGDIRFVELPRLDLSISSVGAPDGRKVRIALDSFEVRSAGLLAAHPGIQSGSDCIDYWAVDWDFRPPAFLNGWQSFRTRQNRTLELQTPVHTYPDAGTYRILVKVIDIFGHDTCRLVSWEAE